MCKTDKLFIRSLHDFILISENLAFDYLDTDSKHLFHSWILHMIQMNDKKSRKFFFNHVFGVFFVQRDSNKVSIQLKAITSFD